MIENDKEFQGAFKEYVKGYGIETNEIHSGRDSHSY